MSTSRIFQIFFGGLLFLGVAFYGYRVANGAEPTLAESFLVTVILTALSWLLSSSLSKSAAEIRAEADALNKIDAIARQSSKKLADQSTNIFELERFVEIVLLQKQAIGESLDETDLYSLIQILRTLRRTNTGLMEDWNGVASEALSKDIRVMAQNQEELFQHIARPNWQQSTESEDEQIKDIARSLPPSAVPSRRYPESELRVVGSVEQTPSTSSNDLCAQGKITAEILRPSYSFTIGGKFNPNLLAPPEFVIAKLVSAPDGTVTEYKVRAGSGTVFDFSVHLKSEEFGKMLPAGKYTFEYDAKARNQ